MLEVNGEEAHMGILNFIRNGNPGLVSFVDNDERLQFKDGDFVVFSEVKGMSEFNDGKKK